MTQQQRTGILLPVGRMVKGSLYKPSDKDLEGKPLVVKTGPNAGKPRVDYFAAVAIPKTPGHQHWAQTDWGAKIYAAGAAAFPQAAQSPSFAWKIEDGDSQVPNKKGRKPCDNEGWPGHWVLRLSGGYAPRVFRRDPTGGYSQILEPDFVKPGHYVQASINVSGNDSSNQPGVYLNHGMLLFVGYGPEIVAGPDAEEVFGAGPIALPPGASSTPVGVAAMPVAAAAMPPPFVPPAPTAAAVAPTTVAPPVPAAVAPPTVVAPHPGFVPLMAMPPAPAPTPAAPAGPVPTAKLIATGMTVDQAIAGGWSIETLRQHGYIL